MMRSCAYQYISNSHLLGGKCVRWKPLIFLGVHSRTPQGSNLLGEKDFGCNILKWVPFI